MNVELVINSFWFLTIITAALYIAKKRYIGKKNIIYWIVLLKFVLYFQ